MELEGCKFSGGIEKANLILSTGILQRSWGVIYKLQQSPDLRFDVEKLPKFTIMAFSADQSRLALEACVPPLQYLDKNDDTFGFLATKKNPSFSIHSSPLSAFRSLLETTDLKEQLKVLTAKGQPRLILVGESLGGSVAALCTLWLLKSSPLLLPICVTFGSPFLGDDSLQKAVSDINPWKTHFWHVVGHGDPIPRLSLTGSFRPLGTYFLVSGSTCACFDHPDSIVELLELGCPDTTTNTNTNTDFRGYGAVLQQLIEKRKYRINAPSAVNPQDSLNAGLSRQLAAAGVGTNHQNGLLQVLEKREKEIHNRRKKEANPSKQLNDIKRRMAQLEWYIKTCNSKNTVYYDCYKNRSFERDTDIRTQCKARLNPYWKKKVEEAESKPQAPDARMRTRWLFSGVTYMRMVEPLDIAEHYLKPREEDYLSVRAEHYKLLDKWNDDESRTGEKKKDKAPILTEDSCFWARVEEAKLKLDELRIPAQGSDRELQLKKELIEFEAHIMKLVKNYELSPEVFFETCSFMEWWRQYYSLNPANTSSFACFMKEEAYKNYK